MELFHTKCYGDQKCEWVLSFYICEHTEIYAYTYVYIYVYVYVTTRYNWLDSVFSKGIL